MTINKAAEVESLVAKHCAEKPSLTLLLDCRLSPGRFLAEVSP
jgi:hypothetical protein